MCQRYLPEGLSARSDLRSRAWTGTELEADSGSDPGLTFDRGVTWVIHPSQLPFLHFQSGKNGGDD